MSAFLDTIDSSRPRIDSSASPSAGYMPTRHICVQQRVHVMWIGAVVDACCRWRAFVRLILPQF